MSLYHTNPATGESGRCSAASPEKCPFGGEHYPTVEEARAAYETENADSIQGTPLQRMGDNGLTFYEDVTINKNRARFDKAIFNIGKTLNENFSEKTGRCYMDEVYAKLYEDKDFDSIELLKDRYKLKDSDILFRRAEDLREVVGDEMYDDIADDPSKYREYYDKDWYIEDKLDQFEEYVDNNGEVWLSSSYVDDDFNLDSFDSYDYDEDNEFIVRRSEYVSELRNDFERFLSSGKNYGSDDFEEFSHYFDSYSAFEDYIKNNPKYEKSGPVTFDDGTGKDRKYYIWHWGDEDNDS